MQSGEGNPPAGSQKTLRPLELVFSCSVCDESIHDIYKFSEDAQGFSDQRQSNQKVVTRMWLTECGHLTCSKHLADGAAPFHPAGTPPAAPCPVCVCKHGDDSPKHLFGIRGFAQGEYDCEIPSRFFECPPRILDSNDGGMDAIRFQFLRLVSYGTAMTQKVSASREAHAQIFEQLEKQRMENRRLTSQIDTMTERTKLYEKNESLLEKYKRKEPEVTHYLAAFAEMATELHQLRAELVELGYDASRKDYTYKPTPSPKATASINESAATYDPTGTITAKSNSRQQETHVPDASERTLRGSSSDTLIGGRDQSSPCKRKREPEQPADRYLAPRRIWSGQVARQGTMLPPALPATNVPRSRHDKAELSGSALRSQGHVPYDRSLQKNRREITVGQDGDRMENNDALPLVRQRSVYRRQSVIRDEHLMSDPLPFPEARISGYYEDHSSESGVVPRYTNTVRRSPMVKESRGRESTQTFFTRSLPVTQQAEVYHPGQNTSHKEPAYMDHDEFSLHGAKGVQVSQPYTRRPPYVSHTSMNPAPILQPRTFAGPRHSPIKQQPLKPYTPSPQRKEGLRWADTSVASPFFQPGGAVQQSRHQGESSIRPTGYHGLALQDVRQGFKMHPAQEQPSRSPSRSRRHTIVRDPYYVTEQQSLYEHPASLPSQYIRSNIPPQTPRDSHGYLMRPDRQNLQPPQTSHSNTQLQRFRYAEPLRSTQPSLFPSSRSLLQTRGEPRADQTLNSFPGVKGASGSLTTYNTGAGSFGSQRPVFSRAGAVRRKVMR